MRLVPPWAWEEGCQAWVECCNLKPTLSDHPDWAVEAGLWGDRCSEPLSRSSSSHTRIGWGMRPSAFSSTVPCLLFMFRPHHRTSTRLRELADSSGSVSALAWVTAQFLIQAVCWAFQVKHAVQLHLWLAEGYGAVCRPCWCLPSLHSPASVLGGRCTSALLCGLPLLQWRSL